MDPLTKRLIERATARLQVLDADPDSPRIGEMWLRADLANGFFDDFSGASLDKDRWRTIVIGGAPSVGIDNGKLAWSSSTSDRGMVVARTPLHCDRDQKLRFEFHPSDMARSDGSVVTPVVQRGDSIPSTYDGGNNALFFRVNGDGTHLTVERPGSTQFGVPPSDPTNLIRVEVTTVPADETVAIVITDLTDNNAELANISYTYTQLGITTASRLWFAPCIDPSISLGYAYKFTEVEIAQL